MTLALVLFLFCSPAFGQTRVTPNEMTGIIQSTATGNYLLRVATATYLATAPGDCTAGQYISGLLADGTKTCGTPSGAGDVVLAATQTFTGENTFQSSTTFSGSIFGNTRFASATSTATFSGWVDIGLQTVSVTCTSLAVGTACSASCSSIGKKLISGGCQGSGGYPMYVSGEFVEAGAYSCVSATTQTTVVYAVCMRVK